MQLRFRPWHLAALMVILCITIITVLAYFRIRSNFSAADLAARLPEGESTIVYIDAEAFRKTGLLELLGLPEVAEEAEYQRFVEESGFDYRRDLDAVLASFHENEVFLLIRGRFDWGRLVDVANERGGDCYNGFCRVEGSVPDRRISFFAVTPLVMGMAVSRDSWAAVALDAVKQPPPLEEIPEQPVWVTVSGPVLRRSDWLPASARSLVSAVSEAERITLALGPSGTDFEAQLSVDCNAPAQAARLTAQLEGATRMLRGLIHQGKKATDPEDLSGVLAAGSFRSEGRRVEGRWPIGREFLEAVAAGSE